MTATVDVTFDLIGTRWIVVEQQSEPWRSAFLPYVDFEASRRPGDSGPALSGNDGCNWYEWSGTLDHDRLAGGERISTAMDCGPGRGGVALGGGDRLRLTDDGTILEVYGSGSEPRLRFLRLDSLQSADATQLAGRWSLDAATPAEIGFDTGGTMTIGACTWSWSLEERLTVSAFPENPYACLGPDTVQASGRLVEMLVSGPVDAWLHGDGDVYLTDDRFVIRLSRVDT